MADSSSSERKQFLIGLTIALLGAILFG